MLVQLQNTNCISMNFPSEAFQPEREHRTDVVLLLNRARLHAAMFFAIKGSEYLWNLNAAEVKLPSQGENVSPSVFTQIPQRSSPKSNDSQLSPTHHARSGMPGNTQGLVRTKKKCSPGSESKDSAKLQTNELCALFKRR